MAHPENNHNDESPKAGSPSKQTQIWLIHKTIMIQSIYTILILLFSNFSIAQNVQVIVKDAKQATSISTICRYNPLYSQYDSIKFIRHWQGKFELTIDEPGFYSFLDNQNLGMGVNLFIEPGDTVAIEYYANERWINASGKHSQNNNFYPLIYDSLLAAIQVTNNVQPYFTLRDDISKFGDSLIDVKIIQPFKYKILAADFSPDFYKNAYLPQLNFIGCYLKNLVLKKFTGYKAYKKFSPDSTLLNPHYKYWTQNFWEEGWFDDYLLQLFNKNTNLSLDEYIDCIKKLYPENNDKDLHKIAIAHGLKIYLSHFSITANFQTVINTADSLMKAYQLDKNKMILPSFMLANSGPVESASLDSIVLFDIDNTRLHFSDLIKDTNIIYYIDHWASWCHPCIEGIPFSISIQKKYVGKVKVLFLDNDKNHSSFKYAVKKYHMPAENCYRIDLEKNEIAYRRINPVNFIPVYQLLFYRHAKWFVIGALRPSDFPVHSQIESFLNLKN